jgi:hypothetical protein
VPAQVIREMALRMQPPMIGEGFIRIIKPRMNADKFL